MNHWSHIRSFVYSSAIVGLGLTLIAGAFAFGAFLGTPVNPDALIVVSLFLIAKVSLFTGQAHPEIVYSSEPLDPHFSFKWLLVAIFGAVTIQFGTSWLHEMTVFTSEAKTVLPDKLPLFLKLMVIGIIFPVLEEVGFRQILWKNVKKLGTWLGIEDQSKLAALAAIYTTNIFVMAHVPTYGFTYSLFLLPATLLFTFLRTKTGGIFTSSVAHMVFNSTAVLLG